MLMLRDVDWSLGNVICYGSTVLSMALCRLQMPLQELYMAKQSERLGQVTLERYSTTPLFNTKAVVRQTGIPAPTLRAWERRYGILSPQRGPNDYRLYSERDIAIIRWLREQVENGLSISQAI